VAQTMLVLLNDAARDNGVAPFGMYAGGVWR